MPEFIRRPDIQHLPPPYRLHGVMTCCFLQSRAELLQDNFLRLLNASVAPRPSPGAPPRFTPAFGGWCAWAHTYYRSFRSMQSSPGALRFQEGTLLIPVRDATPAPGAPDVFWFAAVLVLDSQLAVIAGREFYGMPKVVGGFDPPTSDGPPTVDSLTARTTKVEGYRDTGGGVGEGEYESRMPLATVTPEAGGRVFPRGDKLFTEKFARGQLVQHVLALSPMPWKPALLSQPGSAVDPQFAGFFEAWAGCANLQLDVPGIFLKQFPCAENMADACFSQLTWARTRPVDAHGMRAHMARLELAPDSISFHLREQLGFTGGEVMATTLEAEWEIEKGQALLSSAPETPTIGLPEPVETERVAILGGGLASLVTALELTRPGKHRKKYDVTIFQMGWRLGGKGASGRNAAANQRIEEHGLHYWMGFYENAFRMMREVLAEWQIDRTHPWACEQPADRWKKVFTPHDCTPLADLAEDTGEWSLWHFHFLPTRGTPGDGTKPFTDVWGMLRMLAGALREAPVFVQDWCDRETEALPPEDRERAAEPARLIYELCEELSRDREATLAGVAAGTFARLVSWRRALFLALRLVRQSVRWMHSRDERLQRLGLIVNLGWSLFRGLAWNALRIWQGTLDALDGYDLRDFLRSHGATEAALDSPLLAAIYDGVFAYQRGRIGIRDERLAAGAGIRCFFRIFFSYKGAVVWKMNAGMGDAIFTPIYEVLRERKVKFEFFHTVKRLRVSDDRLTISSVELCRQVRLAGSRTVYDPLSHHPIQGLRCWPSQPDWEQIAGGAALQAAAFDFEDPRTALPIAGAERTLYAREPGGPTSDDHFDRFVLGIPVGALRPICRELMKANEKFKDMIEHVKTVRTGAFQVWLKPNLEETGWPQKIKYPDEQPCCQERLAQCGLEERVQPDSPLLSNFLNPLNTWSDMSHLLPMELHPAGADAPRSLHYFCGPMPDDIAPEDGIAHVEAKAAELLDAMSATWWPETAAAGGGFDRAHLAACAPYARFNHHPSDRYTLTLPGSTKFRLRAHESGFANLTLAGDWTHNQMNIGCIEATVMSGRFAAHHISKGWPRPEDITYSTGP